MNPGTYCFVTLKVLSNEVANVRNLYRSIGYDVGEEKMDGEYTTVTVIKPWSKRHDTTPLTASPGRD